MCGKEKGGEGVVDVRGGCWGMWWFRANHPHVGNMWEGVRRFSVARVVRRIPVTVKIDHLGCFGALQTG